MSLVPRPRPPLVPSTALAVLALLSSGARAKAEGDSPCAGPLAARCEQNRARYLEGTAACGKGDVSACERLSAERDLWPVRPWLSRGCELGSAYLCFRLAEMNEAGAYVDEAEHHYRRACSLGSEPACVVLVERQLGDDVDAWRRAAERCKQSRDAAACARLITAKGPLGGRSRREVLLVACEGGRGDACATLGRAHQDRREPELAARSFQRGCVAGHAESCGLLSKLHHETGIPDDLERWAKAECKANKELVCRGFVEATGTSDGLVAGAIAARSRDEQSRCEAREPGACFRWGKDRSFVGDAAGARLAWQTGCAQDDRSSCHSLAAAYAMRRDHANALLFYDRACALSNLGACSAAESLRDELARRANAPAQEKACGGNDRVACRELAVHLRRLGRDEHLPLLEKACRLGDAEACAAIEQSEKIARERKDQADAARAACEGGAGAKCLELATRGRAGAAERRRLAERACELGTADGCAHVFGMERGAGYDERAFPWLERACSLERAGGDSGKSACANLARLRTEWETKRRLYP